MSEHAMARSPIHLEEGERIWHPSPFPSRGRWNRAVALSGARVRSVLRYGRASGCC